ncbi:helicase-related protein [Plantactinospora sp. B6F1]|uniref:helicase-related protein n=1 Tax=Plantactinospora sp. B6F1 TaxID=3158971 RepID=UPI0032D938A0
MTDHEQFARVTPGARFRGIVPDGPITVLASQPVGATALKITYEFGDGQVGQRLLYASEVSALRADASASQGRAFDADAAAFRLAAEALRIRMAGLFDPMLAVHTSELEPLPHQIRAVYGEMLPRTPLRFLLADDPGAGKTIMAGLYVKELLLRGDALRCLIVAPGGLVEQWQDELLDKFGLRFDLLTRDLAEANVAGSVFDRYPMLIARMDQLSRSDELLALLERSEWDLVVVDEAHRMSAHYFGRELKTTRRYDLGRLLGRQTRHLLLMTATPHAGKEEDFQLFLALLDQDRFEGRYRAGAHSLDTGGVMRRMVKEELLRFDGTALFPERRASTVPYPLSPGEQRLYDEVTAYVRGEWNRVDALRQAGEGGRGNTVGFALTVLQRRLASSPEAIWRSLERRRRRLESRRQEVVDGRAPEPLAGRRFAGLIAGSGPEQLDANLDDLDADELETFEGDVVDAASAARTIAELDQEIAALEELAALACRVRNSGDDRKWGELRELLLDPAAMRDASGRLRKLIIFTEHRDTLGYLVERIGGLIGPDAVLAIHGGVRRQDRRHIQEAFTHDRDRAVLVATDAAGEGLNLQCANLMVNYDLPWNPNRIEQRFGRIHRIGQTEVCHLWNLVARDTREGAVFLRLLGKLEEQRRALGTDKVFDVLGEAFDGQPLRELLVEALRYGDRPERREWLTKVIDARVGDGLAALLAERALHRDLFSLADLEAVRRQMEEARARRLQPYFIEAFFLRAFAEAGGRINRREAGRWEVTHVPAALRDRPGPRGGGTTGVAGTTGPTGVAVPMLRRYERVCFDREQIRQPGRSQAELLAPGHPLLDVVVTATIERYGALLRQGALLVDERDGDDQPRLLVALTQRLTDGHTPARTVSERFEFVELSGSGAARSAGVAPYLDYRPLGGDESALLAPVVEAGWWVEGAEESAVAWAVEHGMAEHLAEVRERIGLLVRRTREQVTQRLTQEINYWYGEEGRLAAAIGAGRQVTMRPETARRRAEELERRLERRTAELDRDGAVMPQPPTLAGVALVVPQGLLDRLAGRGDPAGHATDPAVVDERAVAAVLAAERALGRAADRMPHNNPGYDVRSRDPGSGERIDIEVKGRVAGATDFFVSRTQVFHAKNVGPAYRLALVSVDPTRGPEHDEVRYLANPFLGADFGDFESTGITGDWADNWARARPPW